MEAKTKLDFIFNEEDFVRCTGKHPKDQEELEQFAEVVIDQIRGSINYDVIYEAVNDCYSG